MPEFQEPRSDLTSVFVRENRKKLQEEEEAKERLRNQTTLVSL